jgi:hypothetical protein
MSNYEEQKQRARERKDREEAEVKALFPERVKQVAALMGLPAVFTMSNGEPFARCTAIIGERDASKGRSIHLSTQDYSPDFRLCISGDYEMGDGETKVSWPYRMARPSITVGLRRDAAAIAKEIKSRFLPDYDAACAKLAELLKQATEYRDAKRGALARLAQIAGVEIPKKRHEWDNDPESFWKYYGKESCTGPRLEVKVSADSADIKIDCGIELAATIVKAIEALLTGRN